MRWVASRPRARMFLLAIGIATCVTAYFRGRYLLGTGDGVMCVVVSLALLWLFVQSLEFAGRLLLLRVAVVAILSLGVGFVMAFPASINRDMRHFIDKQTVDRGIRTELEALFASDPAYHDLSASTAHLKSVNVTVRGSLPRRADFGRLRARYFEECPTSHAVFVHWDIQLVDHPRRINGIDSQLFPTEQADVASSER